MNHTLCRIKQNDVAITGDVAGGFWDGRDRVGHGVVKGKAHVIACAGLVVLDEHGAIDDEVATLYLVAGEVGVEMAHTVGVFGTEDAGVAK